MTPSQEFITVSLRDPVSGEAQPRRMQWRTVCQFRNTGSVLIYRPPHQARSSLPVVIEDFEALVTHHRALPDAVYELVHRPTYHIPTFAAALSIVCDPAIPAFTQTSDIVPFRPYCNVLSNGERARLTAEWASVGPLKRVGRITNRYDCVMSAAKASAFVGTSIAADSSEVAVEVLKDFHDTCAYAHFLASRVEDKRQRELWGNFFSRQSFMFYGLNDSVVSEANRDAVWRAAATGVPASVVRAEPALAAALTLNITPLMRQPSSLGYRLLRLMA
eukprot:CAMPEP_0174856490 /NCGR_PEP_ID=MMETSP1114-20130205/36044_1 /TAXON_ID=312471 /ORGANISM="Neobodo designis, Strain CCAP 1951/1" /LENGTH=274 /DNA_ID=CAMNT_0016091289 /DNA_START=65 /DNA_END=885 /DNA_ORIENTATION=+